MRKSAHAKAHIVMDRTREYKAVRKTRKVRANVIGNDTDTPTSHKGAQRSKPKRHFRAMNRAIEVRASITELKTYLAEQSKVCTCDMNLLCV